MGEPRNYPELDPNGKSEFMATTITDRDPTIPPENSEQSDNLCLTILFAEAVCSKIAVLQEGANAAQTAMGASDELILYTVQKHQGRVIKAMGTSLIAEFSNPIEAIHAAVGMERLSVANPAFQQGTEPGLRIGIYTLENHRPEISVFSSMVTAAANITKQATSGQILISVKAYQRVSKQAGPHCQWSRAVSIDGSTETEDIFEVSWQEAPPNIPSRYEVLSQVGKGGMGIVHKVRDRETNEIIALKILKPEIAGDPAMQENLRREVCLARKVTHKNICRIHEFNRSNGAAFISMEFVTGESLLAMLHRSGPFSWNEAVHSALQICAGLREAHIQGIVHRDLKPANIMVDLAGSVKVMDFGIARLFQGTGQMTGTMVGTPAYMAPEQLELKRVDARTDVYALGLLLYEMVTGVQPFVGETPIAVALKHLREYPKRPREVMPTIPAYAEGVILKCLQKDPAKRFQSVDELTMALKREGGRRPAVSQWNCFVADFSRAARDLQRVLQFGVNTAETFFRNQDWQALISRPSKKTIAAGLATTCLLSGLIVFAASRSRKSDATGPIFRDSATTVPNQNSPSAIGGQESRSHLGRVSGTSAIPPITSFEVDLNGATGPVTDNNVSVTATNLDAPSTNRVAPSESKAMRNKQNVKMQLAARVSAPFSATTRILQVQPPSVVWPVATLNANEASKTRAGDTSHDASTTDAAATPTETVANEKTPAPTVLASLYLEVGSFKDSTWAEHAVEKLTQLGFQSVAIRKVHLWMQSFQVRVGPYVNQTDLEEARKKLASQGFKPHPVK
jgi:serine/threonine protein kinase/class 3 adenylate cyclase